MSSLVLGGLKMIDQFINFIIRPPRYTLLASLKWQPFFFLAFKLIDSCWNRAEYDPDQYLWEKDFSIGGTKCKRQDLEASMMCKTSYCPLFFSLKLANLTGLYVFL